MSETDASSFNESNMNKRKMQFSCQAALVHMRARVRSWLNVRKACLLLQCIAQADDEQQEEQNQTEERKKLDPNMNEHRVSKNRRVFSDANPFLLGAVVSLRQREELIGSQRVNEPENLYYDMSKTKYLLIFNHEEFNYAMEFGFRKPKTRHGTKSDVENLKTTFKALGFTVKIYQDLSDKKIIKNVEKFVNQDHSNTSCVFVVVLTHGECNGYLYAKNKPYRLDDIIKQLQQQKLVLIPKVLIVQACRGEYLDEGYLVEIDGMPKNVLHVPTHSDLLILRPSYEGYVSFRNTIKGSWMIQHLCAVIKEYHSTMDILQMITIVNMRVSRNTAYNIDDLNVKQSLEATFSFTKLLKLSI